MAKLAPLTVSEAYRILAELTGWPGRDIEAKPSDALWAAGGRIVEARDVVVASIKSKKGMQ